MHSEEIMQWLKEKNLFEVAKVQVPNLKRLLTNSLNVSNEAVMIVGDYGIGSKVCAPVLAAGYYMACKSIGLSTVLVMEDVKDRSQEASIIVRHLLKKLKRENIVINSMSNRLGKLGEIGSLRDLMKKRKHKYVLTTGLGGITIENIYRLSEAINIDYKKVDKLGERIKKELDWAREIRIVTLNGTKLKIDIKGHSALLNTGYVKSKGMGGNIPAGEVYIAPTKNGVEGQVIIDGSSRHKNGTMMINKPIKITISRGMITKIEGNEEARTLKESIDWIKNKVKVPSNASMIGEIGIGINPKARIIGATIVDEKAYGTAHIGIGGNSWFGGHIFSTVHLDQVFRNPVIMIDGKELKMPARNELE